MDDMLGSMSSHELAEWQAYERVAGPLDGTWRDETLSSLHELIQQLNHLLGAAHFTDKKHKNNPVPEPERWIRPYEMWDKAKERNGQL